MSNPFESQQLNLGGGAQGGGGGGSVGGGSNKSSMSDAGRSSPRSIPMSFSGTGGPGTRTPTDTEFRHTGPMTPPAHVGMARPTTGVTIGDSLGPNSGLGFGLREPPKMRRALTKDNKSGLSVSMTDGSNEDGTGNGNGAGEDHSSMKTDSSNSSSSERDRTIRGTLTVKLISARNLAVTTTDPNVPPEPYVVVQFDQNEFISRPAISPSSFIPSEPPIPEPTTPNSSSGKTNLPRTNSYGPSLGIASISRAFADAARRTTSKGGNKTPASAGLNSGQTTPRAPPESPQLGSGAVSWANKNSPADPVWKEDVSFDVTASPGSILSISVYDRSRAGEGFLGVKEIKPVLRDGVTIDNWFALSPRGDEHVTGEIWLQISYDAVKNKTHLSPRHFEILKLIGRGTFGKVFQVRKRDTKRIYAMKMLSKKDIVAKKEIAHTIGERKILQQSLECPFLVGLKFSFQTEEYLFFVTDYKSGGELFWHLQKEGRFTEPRARFYIAELVLALEHLHRYDIVYRDLKPENILLDATGHVALCDFGLSKPDLGSGQLTNTFCGTTEYLAPEVLLDDHGYSKLVDFWSLGVLLFEMCCGWSPFYAEDVQQMYKNICFGKIRFPRGVIGEDGKQFVKGLLNRNPKHRLGSERDAAELKEHPFFKNIDWSLLAAKQITPPFKPMVESDESVSNFDPTFTSSDLRDIPFDWSASDDMMVGSVGHSYNGPGGGIAVDKYGKPSASGGVGGGGTGMSGSVGGNGASGMAIKPNRPPLATTGSPLTSSVQANFRGFTYTGESSVLPMSHLAHGDEEDSDEYEEDDGDAFDEDDFDPQDVGEVDNHHIASHVHGHGANHGHGGGGGGGGDTADITRRTSDVNMDA